MEHPVKSRHGKKSLRPCSAGSPGEVEKTMWSAMKEGWRTTLRQPFAVITLFYLPAGVGAVPLPDRTGNCGAAYAPVSRKPAAERIAAVGYGRKPVPADEDRLDPFLPMAVIGPASYADGYSFLVERGHLLFPGPPGNEFRLPVCERHTDVGPQLPRLLSVANGASSRPFVFPASEAVQDLHKKARAIPLCWRGFPPI